MTPADIQRLATMARDHFRSVQGFAPVEWHKLTSDSQRAWLSMTELMVSEVARYQQRERLQAAEVERKCCSR